MSGDETEAVLEALTDLSYRGKQLTRSHALSLLRSLGCYGFAVVRVDSASPVPAPSDPTPEKQP